MSNLPAWLDADWERKKRSERWQIYPIGFLAMEMVQDGAGDSDFVWCLKTKEQIEFFVSEVQARGFAVIHSLKVISHRKDR